MILSVFSRITWYGRKGRKLSTNFLTGDLAVKPHMVITTDQFAKLFYRAGESSHSRRANLAPSDLFHAMMLRNITRIFPEGMPLTLEACSLLCDESTLLSPSSLIIDVFFPKGKQFDDDQNSIARDFVVFCFRQSLEHLEALFLTSAVKISSYLETIPYEDARQLRPQLELDWCRDAIGHLRNRLKPSSAIECISLCDSLEFLLDTSNAAHRASEALRKYDQEESRKFENSLLESYMKPGASLFKTMENPDIKAEIDEKIECRRKLLDQQWCDTRYSLSVTLDLACDATHQMYRVARMYTREIEGRFENINLHTAKMFATSAAICAARSKKMEYVHTQEEQRAVSLAEKKSELEQAKWLIGRLGGR